MKLTDESLRAASMLCRHFLRILKRYPLPLPNQTNQLGETKVTWMASTGIGETPTGEGTVLDPTHHLSYVCAFFGFLLGVTMMELC